MTVAYSACYGLLSPSVAMPLYNKMLFYPNFPARYEKARYELKELEGIPKQDVYIASADGKKIHGWYFQNPQSKRLVLVSHGNAANITYRTQLASDLLQLGTSVLMYDYQGFGLSEGAPSIRNICDDGLAAYNYATNQLGYKDADIILYGESLGCAVACHTSAQHKCAAIVLESGFSSLKRIAGEKMPILRLYPATLYPKPLLDNVAILKQSHAPLLIVHGEQDLTVPISHGRRVFQQATEPKQFVLLPNSGHFIAKEDHDVFMAGVRKFFGSLDHHS